MRLENQLRLDKIRRSSRVLRVLCKVFMGLMAVGFLAGAIALLVNMGGTVRYFNVSFTIGELTLRGRLILLVLSALTFGVGFKCFFHLNRLLGNYSHGEIFSRESAGQIRQLGVTCVLWGVLNFVWVFVPLAVAAHPPRSLDGNLDFVFIGLIVVVISWFMEMAAELREENELTI